MTASTEKVPAKIEEVFQKEANAQKEASITPTDMLYFEPEGNFYTSCDARVLSWAIVDKHTVAICLDRTILHAQGGGQPSDRGTIVLLDSDDSQPLNVTKIVLDKSTGVATHTATLEDSSFFPFRVGDIVHVAVDEENRRLLAECHTAGHVVDSAMKRAGTGMLPTKGYHFLEGPYVEYKGSVPLPERPALLEKLQTVFQELVHEDIETKIEILSNRKAQELCDRVAENFFDFSDSASETVRIVTVAGWPSPCGGTHVKSTGELKDNKWNITGLKCKKGAVRVKYGRS